MTTALQDNMNFFIDSCAKKLLKNHTAIQWDDAPERLKDAMRQDVRTVIYAALGFNQFSDHPAKRTLIDAIDLAVDGRISRLCDYPQINGGRA